jgi:Restriction endonuclease
MSGWLNDAVDGYLANVTEREFDSVFIAILRATGFSDVHQIHGAFEFGKDFIAKRDGQQWAFQTKAGDIGLTAWRPIRSQIEEMLWNEIAHPRFDTSAPRRAVLVTTGRLVGGAAADAQQYAATLARRSPVRTGSDADDVVMGFDVWDRDTVAELLTSSPELSLNDWGREPLRALLGLLADTDRRAVTHQMIETSTRGWERESPWQAVLAGSVAAHRLRADGRVDLACSTAYALSRAGALLSHAGSTAQGESVMDAARALFRDAAAEMIQLIGPTLSDPDLLFRASTELPGSTTYPIRCSLIAQTLGMLGLVQLVEGETDAGKSTAARLEKFVTLQPGASHPISDRWAMSLVPASLLLFRTGSAVVEGWLEQVTVWICDRHADEPGLASVYASPDREIQQLLGDPYEHLDVRSRKQSFLATVVLDLAAVLGLNDLYRDALNDFIASDLAFPVVEPRDELGLYGYDGPGLYLEANVQFDDFNNETDWRRATHHRRALDSYALDRQGRSWELLACSLLLRDRHLLSTSRVLAGLTALAA